jgi:isopentenyl-diphosphate delta-isomerase
MITEIIEAPLTSTSEEVVLLDSSGRAIGKADKYRIHTEDTPLHSAFSIFLFNRRGQMLVQQRAWSKQTWPGVWSNACCGHPSPGESVVDAAKRRLDQELGLKELRLHLALPHFRYRAEYLGIVENEICPVFVGLCHSEPDPNPDEVEAVDWIDWEAFANEAPAYADYSPWSKWEAAQLKQTGRIDRLFDR